ncbi:MAG: DUF3604 domain-containing protein [Halobacteriaceae archaeon]
MQTDLGPPEQGLFWADLHKHMTGPGADRDRLDGVLADARAHLDVAAVLCYPFKWFRKGREGGIREETVGHRPEYGAWWATVQDAAAEHNDPGSFVTFPGYEWHGGRRRWGDHNVLFRGGGELPVSDADDLAGLYATLRDAPVEAVAVPHHTGYRVGERGKDWDAFDPELSPVMEVYSGHGSSEGVGTPVSMDDNPDMGPRTSGGTYQDALARGRRVGAVASNDGPGTPGSWGRGVAGIWAEGLTRAAVWAALRARRTYASTGDRIALWYELDGHPMGAAVAAGDLDGRTAEVAVDCPGPLDRVTVVRDETPVAAYRHLDWTAGGDRRRVLVEVGWGPTTEYGDFSSTRTEWGGTVRVDGGAVRGVAPRFAGASNSYEVGGGACRFDLVTVRGDGAESVLPEAVYGAEKQGLVLEVERGDRLRIDLDDGPEVVAPLGEEARVAALTDESRRRIEAEFDLPPDDIDNPDIVYHNARKVKVHPAHPVAACRATVAFDDLHRGDGEDAYYVRARQVDGQYAWSSPVFVE